MDKFFGVMAIASSAVAWAAHLVLGSDLIITDPMNPRSNWLIAYLLILAVPSFMVLGVVIGTLSCIVGCKHLMESVFGLVGGAFAIAANSLLLLVLWMEFAN